MKHKFGTLTVTDAEEQQATAELKGFLSVRNSEGPTVPSQPYWSNLIVRTNQGIDEATSGKAISISWAARVAIPGVVALIFFFIGLHYYVPQQPVQGSTLTTVVSSLPAEVVDSLLAQPQQFDSAISSSELRAGLVAVSHEQLSEYLISDGKVGSVLETMSDQQVNDFLVALGSKKTNL
jgi:hypothetical protein